MRFCGLGIGFLFVVSLVSGQNQTTVQHFWNQKEVREACGERGCRV